MKVLITVLIIVLISNSSSYEIIQGELGKSAVFECSNNETTVCAFIPRPQDGEATIIVNRKLSQNQRFSIRNSESCIIDFNPVQLNDTTHFFCKTDSEIKEYFFVVFVVPKDEYMMYNGEKLTGREIILPPNKEKNAYFECHSYQTYPNPNIHWYVDNYPEKELKKKEKKKNNLWNVKSAIMIKPHRLRNTVSCIFIHGYGDRKVSITAKFANVSSYVDLTETTKINGINIILINEVKEITCKTDGIPTPDILIKRKIKNEWEIVANKSDHLLKYDVIDSGIYICEVQYHYGTDAKFNRNLISNELIFRNYGKDQEEVGKTLSNLDNKMEEMSNMIQKIMKHLKLKVNKK